VRQETTDRDVVLLHATKDRTTRAVLWQPIYRTPSYWLVHIVPGFDLSSRVSSELTTPLMEYIQKTTSITNV